MAGRMARLHNILEDRSLPFRTRSERFKETGSVKDRPRSGRPVVLDEEDGETLAETVAADPFTTLPQFQNILRDENVVV